jgi:hypothetical protein
MNCSNSFTIPGQYHESKDCDPIYLKIPGFYQSENSEKLANYCSQFKIMTMIYDLTDLNTFMILCQYTEGGRMVFMV